MRDVTATEPIDTQALPERIRHRFPIFEHRVYINSCSQGALSNAVRDAYEQYLSDWDEQGAPWEYWVERQEAADGTLPLEHFDAAIDEDTLLVSITHVCYRNGAMVDVRDVVDLAHERGAYVLLDAFQSVGSLPVDVKELNVDFLGAGVLKYLLGSAGLGFLYARSDVVEKVSPTATGWFADENIFAMDHTDYSPARTAARFQSGTPPVPSIYAGIAGME